jgi:hypothetical protein
MQNEPNSHSDSGQVSADKRAALLDKISALLAKTKDHGCTEAEALAAAELASKLMAKYGLSLSELESISTPADVCEADGAPIGMRRSHEVLRVSHAIAHYTDTRSWYHRHGIIHVSGDKRRLHAHRGVLLVYFGLVADVQVAIYLTNILRTAMDVEWKTYWNAHRENSDSSPRTARANFMRGMAERISTRLYSMKEAQNKASDNNCRAIVLVKKDIVKKAFAVTQIKVRTVTRREGSSDWGAYHAGTMAGGRVTIASGALHSGRRSSE